jgi:Tol biopolymer transport system component
MEVTFVPSDEHEGETFVLVGGRDEAIRVPITHAATTTYGLHLSHDGTRLIVAYDEGSKPRLGILDLVTGSRQDLGGKVGYCPRLSPDNRTVAVWQPGADSDPLVLVDVVTGEGRVAKQAEHPATAYSRGCNEVAWSPDGRLLAMPDGDGTLVTGRDGQTVTRFPKRYAVNGEQSWSPDGTRILLYDQGAGRYVIRDVSTGAETTLGDNRIMTVPVGWAGSRVVWLAGTPGDQRLVTTGVDGADARLWIRFDVGARAVETVSWSQALAGSEA